MSGRTQPRARLSARAAGLVVVALLLVTAGILPLRQYLGQRSEIGALDQQVQELRQERLRLERRIARLQDPAYLERVARECLGMVREGEIAFVAVPEDGKGSPANC